MATDAAALSPETAELLNHALGQWRAAVDSEFGEGTWQALGRSYLRLFLDLPENVTPAVEAAWIERRDRDLDVLAEGLVKRWRLRSKEIDRICVLASASGRSVGAEKLALARVGLLEAASNIDTPVKFRLGTHQWLPKHREREWAIDQNNVAWLPKAVRGHGSTTVSYGRGQWVKGGDGRQVSVTPSALPPDLRLSWYVSAARRAAVDWLADSWMCSDAPAAFDETIVHVALHDEISVADVEDALFPDADLEALAAAAGLTRAESELLDSFLACEGDWQAAAKHLGLNTGALRQRRSRLLTKLKAAA